MKPSLSLLFVILFAFQASYVKSTGSHLDALFAEEATMNVPHQRAIQVLFNLPSIVTGFLEYQDTLRSISQLYQYYLNKQIFENLMHDFFRFVDVDNNGVVTSAEYQRAMNAANIHRPTADRMYRLAAIDNPTRELGFGDFKVAMELLFAESMSTVTFAYIYGGPSHAENVGIDVDGLIRGIQAIWDHLAERYPQPGCDQLEYLFREFDKDGNNLLNPKEFFHVLAIFLRYYRGGLQNFHYAKIVQRDDVFSLLWEREVITLSRVVMRQNIFTASSDYFQLATFERVLNSVGHDIFQVIDVNQNGVLELEEFKTLLDMFDAPESEALLLFTTADTNSDGSVDYGEFLVTFETYVRRALASLMFSTARLNGQQIDLEVCSGLWRNITNRYGVNIGLTDDAFQALFETLDTNDDEVLDNTEFAEFTSAIITSIKRRLREDIDARISVVSGLNATTRTINELYQDRAQAEPNANISIAQGIVSRILSRSSVSRSRFTTETTQTTETSSLGGSSTTSDVITSTGDFDETDQRTFGFIDTGIAPGGEGLRFSLYDAVQQSIQANRREELPATERSNEGAAFGILLQGKLRNIGRTGH